jgi:hypothetical protein
MKPSLLILALIIPSFTAWSQENRITISYGYEFANIEDYEDQATGWRINGLYELNPQEGKFAHGVAFGYTSISASEKNGVTDVKSTVSSWPIYYAPKLMFGDGKAKAFVKGALGMQFASLKREGLVNFSDNDAGFYGGGGAGFMVGLGEKLFLNAEYEIAYVSNSFYDDGWLNSVMFGLGIKF